VIRYDSIVSHNVEDDYASWLKFMESSLKAKDPSDVLNISTLEGVDKKIFYDKSHQYELSSYPSQIQKLQFIDLKKYSPELKAVDDELEIQNFIFQIREPLDLNLVKENATLYILNPTDEIIKESKKYTTYVDVNSLLFKDFKLDVERVREINPNARFVIDLSHIHNSGGSVTQEMTYGICLYKALLEEGIENESIALRVSVDSMLFLNIAKLKSLRFLIEKISQEFNLEGTPFIVGTNSLREQTLYDPWNNILRNSTSSMAQILGGADFVSCRPYDYLFSKLTIENPSPLAYRYARQTLNILLEESHLTKVLDPSLGSHYIENIMHNLIKNSWISILNWDERNFLENAKDFAKAVEAIGKARLKEVRNRKKVITGVNQFAASDQNIESLYKKKWRLVELSFGFFPLRRVASEFEMLRVNYEFSEDKVSALIVTHGELAKINARLNFVQNIFDLIGLEYTVKSLEDINGKDRESDLITLCAMDDDYSDLIAKDFQAEMILIAGKKKNINNAPDNYIEMFNGMDVYKVLEQIVSLKVDASEWSEQ